MGQGLTRTSRPPPPQATCRLSPEAHSGEVQGVPHQMAVERRDSLREAKSIGWAGSSVPKDSQGGFATVTVSVSGSEAFGWFAFGFKAHLADAKQTPRRLSERVQSHA